MRLLQKAVLCFDKLSMNGRNYDDSLLPEPFNKLRRALSKGIFLFCKIL